MGQKGSKKFEGEWDHLNIPRETILSVKESPDQHNWPIALKANEEILSEEESLAASLLIGLEQQHLFENWDLPGVNDDKKHKFFQQVNELSTTYLPEEGGLIAYIKNARELLEKSKNGVNPLEGWIPEVPTGTFLEPFTPDYEKYEQLGLAEIGKCGFVLVAGGLGERLGYNGIKIALPTETLTNTSYIELYCQQILAMQQRYGRLIDDRVSQATVSEDGESVFEEALIGEDNRIAIPLAIMVSDDTEAKTKELLHRNSYFGLKVRYH